MSILDDLKKLEAGLSTKRSPAYHVPRGKRGRGKNISINGKPAFPNRKAPWRNPDAPEGTE